MARRVGVCGRPCGRLVDALERWRSRVELVAIEFRGRLFDDCVDDRTAGGGTGPRVMEGPRPGGFESQNAHGFLVVAADRRVILPRVFHGTFRWIPLRPITVPDLVLSPRPR